MNTPQLRTCDEAGLCIQRPGPGCTCEAARALMPLMNQAREGAQMVRAHAAVRAAATPTATAAATLPHARQLWAVPDVPRATQLHNMRAWRRAVRALGPRWLLATPVARLAQEVRA